MRHRFHLMLVFVCAGLLCAQAFAGADEDFAALRSAYNAKKYSNALDLAEAFIEQHPKDRRAGDAYLLGGRGALRAKSYARAEALYLAMLEKLPEHAKVSEARDGLVSSLRLLRKLDSTIAQCRKNLKADGKSGYAGRWAYMIGESQFRLWRFKTAEKTLREFLKEYRNSAYTRSARRYLDQINRVYKTDKFGVIQDYRGKYVKDVRFQRALRNLPSYVEEAWGVLEKRLGVKVRGRARILFQFKDKGFSRTAIRAQVTTISQDYQPVTLMVFYTEHIVISEEDFRSRVIHECKHAAFRGVMGEPYQDVPKWVREGLAVYAAGQLADRLPLIVGNRVFSGRKPIEVLDGIDDVDHNTDDYLEDAMAFEWLESLKMGNVHRFCKRLVKHEPYKKIFADLAGLPFDTALRAAEKWIETDLRKKLGEGYEQFSKLRFQEGEASRRGEFRAWFKTTAFPAYRKWLTEHAGHPLAPNVRYRAGKGSVLAGDYSEGRKWLRLVVEQDQQRSAISDDALYWIGVSYERENNREMAEEIFGVLLRDYCWCSYAKKVQDRYLPASPVTEEEEK